MALKPGGKVSKLAGRPGEEENERERKRIANFPKCGGTIRSLSPTGPLPKNRGQPLTRWGMRASQKGSEGQPEGFSPHSIGPCP